MFKVTPAAAAQVRESAKQGGTGNMALRIAAHRAGDGSIQYGMGFADETNKSDQSFNSEGVSIVIALSSIGLLSGATLDYVELASGEFNFIFLNPNDPGYVPPEDGNNNTEHHL